MGNTVQVWVALGHFLVYLIKNMPNTLLKYTYLLLDETVVVKKNRIIDIFMPLITVLHIDDCDSLKMWSYLLH